MSRSSFWRGKCSDCGGNTSTAGFAAWNHDHSLRHIDALIAKGWRSTAATLRREREIRQDYRVTHGRPADGPWCSAVCSPGHCLDTNGNCRARKVAP